jgi:hypothetical protein
MNAFHVAHAESNAGPVFWLRQRAHFPIRKPLFMPIRAYLDGHKFDGETIRLMGIAFEMALASLGATPDHDDPIRVALAHRIIALAQPVSAISSVSVRALCGRSALLIHRDGAAAPRAVRRPKPKGRRSSRFNDRGPFSPAPRRE